MVEHQKVFEHIKQLMNFPPILHMPTANEKFKLERDTGKTAADRVLFLFQQGQCLLIG